MFVASPARVGTGVFGIGLSVEKCCAKRSSEFKAIAAGLVRIRLQARDDDSFSSGRLLRCRPMPPPRGRLFHRRIQAK